MSESTASKRVRKWAFRAAGLCQECGEPANGKGRCEKHLAAMRAYSARKRQQRISAGLCTECGTRKPVKGSPYCRKHRAYYIEASRRWYRDGGTCRPHGARVCEKCAAVRRQDERANYRSRRAARKAAGLCLACGDRPPGKRSDGLEWKTCGGCRAYATAYQRARKAEARA